MLATAQQMLQDSKMKIEFIRMQILKASQTSELSFDNNDVMGECVCECVCVLLIHVFRISRQSVSHYPRNDAGKIFTEV